MNCFEEILIEQLELKNKIEFNKNRKQNQQTILISDDLSFRFEVINNLEGDNSVK
jgi:hypothetical protein